MPNPESTTIVFVYSMIYAFVLTFVFMSWTGGVKYRCRDCRTEVDIEDNVPVGRYDVMPEGSKVVEGQKVKRLSWKTVMIMGSICSIITAILVFVDLPL